MLVTNTRYDRSRQSTKRTFASSIENVARARNYPDIKKFISLLAHSVFCKCSGLPFWSWWLWWSWSWNCCLWWCLCWTRTWASISFPKRITWHQKSSNCETSSFSSLIIDHCHHLFCHQTSSNCEPDVWGGRRPLLQHRTASANRWYVQNWGQRHWYRSPKMHSYLMFNQ